MLSPGQCVAAIAVGRMGCGRIIGRSYSLHNGRRMASKTVLTLENSVSTSGKSKVRIVFSKVLTVFAGGIRAATARYGCRRRCSGEAAAKAGFSEKAEFVKFCKLSAKKYKHSSSFSFIFALWHVTCVLNHKAN